MYLPVFFVLTCSYTVFPQFLRSFWKFESIYYTQNFLIFYKKCLYLDNHFELKFGVYLLRNFKFKIYENYVF